MNTKVSRDMTAAPPWLIEAERLLLGAEPIGFDAAAGLVKALSRLDPVLPVSLPWCGVFVAHCLQTAGPDWDLPPRFARARPWRGWGEPADPQLGAVMIFWHLHRVSPFGHVAFYWAEDDEAFHVLGGNQRDRIAVQRYPKSRLLDVRWPPGAARNGVRRSEPKEAALPFG